MICIEGVSVSKILLHFGRCPNEQIDSEQPSPEQTLNASPDLPVRFTCILDNEQIYIAGFGCYTSSARSK